MSAPFRLVGIDHVVLRAADPARLEKFYTEVIGCTLERRQEKFHLTQLRAGRTLIDIVPAPSALPAAGHNVEHVCLRIEPFDRAALAAHLTAHGVTPGEVVPRFGADGTGPSIYLADPEGNKIELKGPPEA